ncbi:efflux RND transporter permease subunit [Caulobacter sp. S45]|uniref:efflux RND transporter permease subunit n=1 Tax=Caulobacter sp. S45 TaxID=1641861 RepID=UPI00131C90EF|nr:efflux RND transporter permease subunit [Caulobacter sp. S45]
MKLRISAWSIRNPIPVAILFIALTLAGLLSYASLPIKQYPNISFPLVVVSVTQSGAAPSEMQNQITRPVEDAIAGVANIKHLSSTVTLGSSVTQIEFELGTDMQKATDDVRTAVDRTRVQLPPGIDPPTVQRIDIDSAPILTYAVSSATRSPVDLSWFVDDTISRTVQAEKGVAQVTRAGGIDREINVTLDPARMAAFGVTAPQVNQAMYQFNVDETGGRANIGGQEQNVRVLGQAQTVDALRKVTIPAAGRYVRLADVAEIGDGQSEQRGFARLDGRPAVAFQVNKTRDASDVSTEKRVQAVIAKLAKAHPDVTFTQVISTVDSTRKSYEATIHVLVEGMILAALVVWLFLKSWRATAIAATAMPLSLIPTFSAIQVFGFSLNVITLLSLTLVIGILVDDAIVEIENIEKRISRGESPYRASLLGADSIGLAVVATTATIVVVFMPVSFMPGIAGQFFKEFGLTVAISVIFSLIVARLLTPLLAAYFLKPSAHPKPSKPLEGPYRKALDWAMAHRFISMGIGGLIFVASIMLLASRPVGFQPRGDAGYFYLNVEGPPGATRQAMDTALSQATRMLLTQPDVERVFAQDGSSATDNSSDLRDGTITVVLKPNRIHKTEEVKTLIRPFLRQIPDVRISTLGGFGAADVEIVLSSQNGPALERVQLELQREMRGLSVLTDVRPAPPPSGPELVVRPKPSEAARLGVTSDALASVLRIATIGDIDANVAKFSEGERRIPIRVRLPESDRTDLSVLANLQVPTLAGKSTPLSSVADLSFQAGPGKIVRYARERRASVQADLRGGASLGTALNAIKKLPVMQHLPADVRQPPVGDAEALQDVITGFTGAILSGILLIYAVLVLLFRSFFKPLIILATLPLTLAGVSVALTVAGMEIDMPVFIGLLMLFGIAAKNSILLVEFAIEDERAGQDRWQALHNACRERARPIVMTTVAMIAGMLPTALALGQGSEFRQPMAIAVIGGLVSSTILSLVLVPVIYLLVDSFEAWLTPKFSGLITHKRPGDDAPIREDEETLVTEGA